MQIFQAKHISNDSFDMLQMMWRYEFIYDVLHFFFRMHLPRDAQ